MSLKKEKLKSGHVSHLRHNEFGQLISNIIAVPAVADIVDSQLADAFMRLKGQESRLQDVRYMNRDHALTAILQQDAQKRREHLVSLRTSILAGVYSEKSDERLAAAVLQRWIKPERQRFVYPGLEIQSRLVSDLNSAKEQDSSIGQALDTLALSELFAHIVSETAVIEGNFRQRNTELSERSARVKEIRQEIFRDLKIFLQSLETAVNLDESGQSPCHSWYSNISRHLEYYRIRLLTRSQGTGEDDATPDEKTV